MLVQKLHLRFRNDLCCHCTPSCSTQSDFSILIVLDKCSDWVRQQCGFLRKNSDSLSDHHDGLQLSTFLGVLLQYIIIIYFDCIIKKKVNDVSTPEKHSSRARMHWGRLQVESSITVPKGRLKGVRCGCYHGILHIIW